MADRKRAWGKGRQTPAEGSRHKKYLKVSHYLNFQPIVFKGSLDRIRISVLYRAKKEHRGTKELQELATKLNRSQNLLQVYLDRDGAVLEAAGNLTFIDELTARELDAFVELFTGVVRRHVLTEDAQKMLE